MRRCVAHGLLPSDVVGVSAAMTAFRTAHRTAVSIGGRASRSGFSQMQGKAPRVKQSTSRDVPQRIAGTTKVRYTNAKGRTFTFSIPVSQLTHPPVIRRGASAAGWREIDTSFSDVGDLEADMPSELGERLTAVRRSSDEGVVVEVNAEQLRGLQDAFVQLCKDYVLMDTNGMKTSMTYSELNNGPDYEHYDRKTRRRRHWIAIRHRFEEVRELLWPTDAAVELRERAIAQQVEEADKEGKRTGSNGSGHNDANSTCGESDGAEEPTPLLPLAAMMEALNWAEAASTFAVRKHRPYDVAAAEDFTPLDLSREVRVVAECIGVMGPSTLVQTHHSGGSCSCSSSSSNSDALGDADQRAAADRFISFAALCANHGVPLSLAFSASSVDSVAPASSSAAAQAWLSMLPAMTRVKDAVRVMAVLQSMAKVSPRKSTAPPLLQFSTEQGDVSNAVLLRALCQLVSPSLFPYAAALENVGEEDLCVLMRFATELHEHNGAFLQTRSQAPELPHTSERQALLHFTQLVIARCRQLLYKTDGPRASLLSGDEENIPLVDLQAFAEHSHPAVRVHTKIGEANAQGLRYARLQSPASATLAQLLRRMEEANEQLAPRTHSLRADLLQHIAHKTALGKARLTLDEVTRALPLLADAMRQTSEQHAKAKFNRLIAAISVSIGVGLQQPQKAGVVLDLLEGLAQCHIVPSSYKLLEMVTLRMMMTRDAFSLGEAARALVAMLQIVGPHGVSQSVQQAVAMRVVAEVEKSSDNAATANNRWDVWRVLRGLRFSLYPSFPSLMLLVSQSPLTAHTRGWLPTEHVRYAVLLAAAAAAAGQLTPSEDDAEGVVASLSNQARAELQMGLDAMPSNLGEEEDAYQECAVTCAALQLEAAPPVLVAWARSPQRDRALHSLCTPLMAVSTLEALEALQLAPSDWSAAYDTYLTTALEQIVAEGKGGAANDGLLEDDAQTAERTLSLLSVSAAARAAATTLLEREVERLDAILTFATAGSSSGSGSVADVETQQPVFTFQQQALRRQTETAALEERLLRYCVVLRRRQAAEEGAADVAPAAVAEDEAAVRERAGAA